MHKASISMTTIIFADDINLFLTNKNIKQLFSDMNEELSNFNMV